MFGTCRCCSALGSHLDILKEYHNDGVKEVFYDMFVKCFDYFLSTNKGLSTLICSKCITRLRDAYSFRTMVEETESLLLSTVRDIDKQLTVFVAVPSTNITENNVSSTECFDIKSEMNEDSPFESEYSCVQSVNVPENNVSTTAGIEIKLEMIEDCPDQNEDSCEMNMANDLKSNLVDGELELLRRFPVGKVMLLPTRQTLRGHCPLFVKYLEKMKGKRITPTNITKLLHGKSRSRTRNGLNKNYVTEKLANTINACTLLENSNATIFKTKTRAGYPCFYCREIFGSMDDLRAHQPEHPKSGLFKLFSRYTADSLVVYADVTDLRCTICEQNVPNLNELKTHLRRAHAKNYYADFEDRIVPFKLKGGSDFECQDCGFNFETFGAIERHMNVHYRNRICEQCGAGFVTMHRLKIHNYTVHREGSFPCGICKKIYVSYYKYKIHFDVVHKLEKKNKCPKCPEKFIDYFTKQKHLVEKHGAAPIRYKCNVCDRSFTRRFSLTGHMRRRHLEQKEIKCAHCQYMCYTKWELKVHMTRHGAEKLFECGLCKKSYTRQKALKEHAKVHFNDRRYPCDVCGQSYTQNCALKEHLKTHHPDFDGTQ